MNAQYDEIEEAAKSCHNCDNCIPIGKRGKRNGIHDGRFDTKEKCCETRRRETGCPVATRIDQAHKLAEHDKQIKVEVLNQFAEWCGDGINRQMRDFKIYKELNP